MPSFRLRILCTLCGLLAWLVSPARGWPLWWKKPVDCTQRNFNTISSIYNLTVYPNQLPVFSNGSAGIPSGLFNENVVGRVDPVGQFIGFQDSIEYFFALSPLPQQNLISAAITGYQITEFSSACSDVAASVVWLSSSIVNPGAPNDGQALPTLKQVAFWKFDECGAVLKYDAWLPNLEVWVEGAIGAAVSDPTYRADSILGICALTQIRCTGNNTQWDSIDECVTALTAKPYGNYDETWGDNVACRTIHIILTQVRPDVHCPHVGPTGGAKCVNVTYPYEYFTDGDLYGDPIGQTFMCS